MTNEGIPVSSGEADVDGELRLRFSSILSGNKLISVYNADQTVLLATIPVTVTAVINCDGTVLSFVDGPIEGPVIIGLDAPVLAALVVDRNGDPMSGIDVQFVYTVPAPIPTRRARSHIPSNIGTTDLAGNAFYNAQNPSNLAVTMQWTAAPMTCEAKLYNPLVWSYGVNCALSSVTTTNATPYKDQFLMVSGTYYPITGASLADSSVTVVVPGLPDETITLDGDNKFLIAMSYNPSIESSYTLQVNFNNANEPCSFDIPVSWQSRVPSCVESSLTFAGGNSPSSNGPPVVSFIIIRDSTGVVLQGVNWSVYSVTRSGWPYSFSTSGVTSAGGQSNFDYPNNGFGAHPDVLQVTVNQGSTECTFETTLNWS
jgi:hypothetical protein